MDYNYLSHFQNVLASLQRITVGGLLAIVIGIVAGFLRYCLPHYLQRNLFFNFLLDAIKYPPPIAWIPFIVLTVGIGDKASWLIVFIGVFPSVFTQTYDSFKNIKSEYLQALNSAQWGFTKKVFFFYIPATLPQIFTGIKVGIGMGWMSIIAAEMISGFSGLGYSIQLSRLNLQYEQMFIDITTIAIVGYSLQFALTSIQSKVVKWKP